jgi:hypothetical protein
MKKEHKHKPYLIIKQCLCGAHQIGNGEWEKPGEGPDPLGQALVGKWLQSSTPEERSEKAYKAAETRWKGRESERRKFMSRIASGPRNYKPRIPPENRCPCGKYSLYLAKKRGHKCEAPTTPKAA